MRYDNIEALVKGDADANRYFNSLSEDLQEALMAHGEGINNLEELKHFAKIVERRG